MSKSAYVLALIALTAGVAFAGCIVEYDANEAGAGSSPGGAKATGGATSAKGGGSTGGSATTSAANEGCSIGPRAADRSVPAALALSLALSLSLRRRRRTSA